MERYSQMAEQTLSYTVSEKLNLPGTIAHGFVAIRKLKFKTTRMANQWFQESLKMTDPMLKVVDFERDN